MFCLPEQLIINNIEALYTSLDEFLSSGEDVCIDISKVEKADTASVQLLCVIQKDLLGLGQSIRWQGKSDALDSSANLLGVAKFLNLTS